MSINSPTTSEQRIPAVSCSDLLAAETTLKSLHDQMAAECQAGMDKWPRDWMQKHVNERACIIKARQILIDRAPDALASKEQPTPETKAASL
jgi:hypothetical protein